MKVEVRYNLIGMSDKYIYQNVAVSHPFDIDKRFFNEEALKSKKIVTLGDLIYTLREDAELKNKIGDFITICISRDNALIYHEASYLKLTVDKSILEICNDLATDEVIIEFFIEPGGASKVYNGYLFVVHSDEAVHKFSVPHVHVKKDDYSPRYRLDTFEMIEGDSHSKQYKKDKKLIQNFLRKNKEWFLKKWNLAIKGYQALPLNENGVMELEDY